MPWSAPIFSDLAPADRALLEAGSVVRRYAKSQLVIQQGDESNSLFLILSGRVKVFVSDGEGKEVIVNTLSTGEYFGELAGISDGHRAASIMTLEPSELRVIPYKAFMGAVTRSPEFSRYVIQTLVERIKDLTDRVAGFALQTVYSRLAKTLTNHARSEHGVMVTHKLTQQELADEIGASREMVGRLLRDLRAGGYVSIKDKRITLHGRLPRNW